MVDCELSVDTEWPLVSILIPAYQSGSALLRAVESVLHQDYPRLQLIVSDDGTPGFQPEELADRITEHLGKAAVQILHGSENVGTVRNLNRALACADGEWIMLLAADDVMYSCNTVSSLLEQARSSGRGWLLARTALCNQDLCPTGKIVPTMADLKVLKYADTAYKRLCYGCFLPSSGALYQRSLLEQFGGFDQRYRLIEDWPLFIKLVRQGLLPEIGRQIDILHREGGVSGKSAGRNQAYQQDLLAVMEQEILPYLELLPSTAQQRFRIRLADKKAIFQYRFCCNTWMEKTIWVIKHPGLLVRKMLKCRGDLH